MRWADMFAETCTFVKLDVSTGWLCPLILFSILNASSCIFRKIPNKVRCGVGTFRLESTWNEAASKSGDCLSRRPAPHQWALSAEVPACPLPVSALLHLPAGKPISFFLSVFVCVCVCAFVRAYVCVSDKNHQKIKGHSCYFKPPELSVAASESSLQRVSSILFWCIKLPIMPMEGQSLLLWCKSSFWDLNRHKRVEFCFTA